MHLRKLSNDAPYCVVIIAWNVIDSARRVTGHPIPAVVKPRRPGDPARLVAASNKARTELGWIPKHAELDQIMISAWEWQQQLSTQR